jgi:Tfp pilus assembly protein PilO
MKATDRAILLGLAIAGLLAAFWFLVLSPKRDEVAKLNDEIASVRESVEEQEALAAYAEQAKNDYGSNYHQLVVLGKAVPGDDDQASLIEQTYALSERAGIQFRGLALAPGGEAAAPTPASQTTTDQAAEGEDEEAAAPVTSAPVPATEAAAATLPIGATVGAAGLPVMPYDLDFRGSFFDIADFLAEMDNQVRVTSKGVGVDGRLLTIDGFTLAGDERRGFPYLQANLHVTSFVAPADQGLTGSATPQAPAPATTAPATPTPTPTSTTTGTTP